MAKENIVTEIVDFPVTINYEEYNVDDYNANDMMLCEYPMVVYKNTIDNEEVFHAELSDALRDTKLQLSFTVDVLNTDTGKKEISLNITDSSLDKYQNLVNAPIRFTLDTSADYPLSTSVFTIKQKTQSENIEISVAVDRQMTLNIVKN